MFCWVLIRKCLGVSVVVDSMDVLLGFNPEVSVVGDSMDVLLGFNPEESGGVCGGGFHGCSVGF